MPQDPEPDPGRPKAPTEPFDRLFMAEYGKVVAVANRVLADRTEAEDVAQEVFLDFHRKHRPDAGYAAAWLHRAAVHTALNRIRTRRRRERRELAEARAGDAVRSGSMQAAAASASAIVRFIGGEPPRSFPERSC